MLLNPRRATFLVFLVIGIGIAGWAPLIPFDKSRLALSDEALGATILAFGLGSIAGLPLAGFLIQRLGAARLCLVAGLIFSLALPLLALAPSAPILAATLAVFGAGFGSTDVGMNAAAAELEQQAGRPLMSGFHAGYSFGALLGAGAASGLLALFLPPFAMAVILSGACVCLLLAAWRHLPAAQAEPSGLALPHGRLLLLGLLAFIAFLAEGAILDWAAVLLRFHRGASPATAGLGFAAFSFAMAIGRFTGDAIVARLSGPVVLAAGSLLALAGFQLAAFLPSIPVIIAACALIGIGLANIVPVLFTAAAQTTGLPPSLAIAAAVTPGYAGMLAGPGLIGFAAQAVGLPLAFGATGILLLLPALCARITNPGAPVCRAPR